MCDLARSLATILQANLWEREGWCQLKPNIASLAQVLVQYIEYLSQKNEKAKRYHASPTPARELSENLRLKVVSKAAKPHLSLTSIEEALANKSNYEYVHITDILPSDPNKRYRLLETLTNHGLTISCILLVYAPGSNIGNLHFLWKVPDNIDSTQCFEQSFPVVEAVKQVLPHYHTRAMRTAMFRKFGKIMYMYVVCVRMCVHARVCKSYMYVCVCTCIYGCMLCVCICVCVHVHAHVCVNRICMCVYVHVYNMDVCMCMYVYVQCVYMCMYAYYMYMYVNYV